MTEPTQAQPRDLQRRAWLDLVTRHLGDVTQDEALACLAMLEEATAESRGELRASERQGGGFWQDEALRLTRITSEIHHMRFDPTTTDEKRWARIAELLPGPPPATTVEGALNALMAEVCENPGVQMECDLANALGVPPGAHDFDEMCSMVEGLKESTSRPAPSDAVMARWVPGTGSELPNGTTGFVAWKAVDGYGVEFSYRRDGGWGSREALNPNEDEPAWADDGDPEFAGKESCVFGRLAITHYMPFALPAPPGGGK